MQHMRHIKHATLSRVKHATHSIKHETLSRVRVLLCTLAYTIAY